MNVVTTMTDLEIYRKDAKKAAVELMYENDVLKKLNQATSTNEIVRIMINARKGENSFNGPSNERFKKSRRVNI